MKELDVIKEFEDSGAILKGHFILSSGLHSDTYMQCARVFMEAKRGERLCVALAKKVKEKIYERIDLIVSPAMGGVIIGYEMGRQFNLPSIFCEREQGKFTLRRGFKIEKGQKILIVEDVVTTGKSSLETLECINNYGGIVIGEACLINRSGNNKPIGNLPLISLAELQIQSWQEDQLPEHLKNIKAIKPGSRFIES